MLVYEADKKIQEDQFNKRLQKIEYENEMLEMKLMSKNHEIAKLEKQFREKRVSVVVVVDIFVLYAILSLHFE